MATILVRRSASEGARSSILSMRVEKHVDLLGDRREDLLCLITRHAAAVAQRDERHRMDSQHRGQRVDLSDRGLLDVGIVSWYGVKEEEPGLYGIIDTFTNEQGRDEHLTGELAKALFGRADELFSEAPKVHRLHVIAQK